ncbi:hypothetical protein CPB85DRAFT_1437009 [Mucidula mucida]|nr:hypothetical protein CPB85DRAFT_1437009 [Mucidula mucida]
MALALLAEPMEERCHLPPNLRPLSCEIQNGKRRFGFERGFCGLGKGVKLLKTKNTKFPHTTKHMPPKTNSEPRKRTRVASTGKKRPAGTDESVPPTGTAQRIVQRRPRIDDVASDSDADEAPPMKKRKPNLTAKAKAAKEAQTKAANPKAAKRKGPAKPKTAAQLAKEAEMAKAQAEQDWVDDAPPADASIPEKGTKEWHEWNLPKLRARWSSADDLYETIEQVVLVRRRKPASSPQDTTDMDATDMDIT